MAHDDDARRQVRMAEVLKTVEELRPLFRPFGEKGDFPWWFLEQPRVEREAMLTFLKRLNDQED